MCFVWRVSTRVLVRLGVRRAGGHRSTARWLHACWLRVFVLLLTLLGSVAQQRVLTPVLRPSASVRVVAERVQSIETDALRAETSLRVVPAPVLGRVPWFPTPVAVWPRFRARSFSFGAPPPPLAPAGPSIAHFHGQRRIPRMNSEDPPRA